MQFSASANLAYLSQPDVRRINTPSRNVGEYFNATSKFDLSYRWGPRFTTVSSLSLNALSYTEPVQQPGNYIETLFGTEARYLWSSRLTVLAEGRYGFTTYPNTPVLESHTIYGLLGGEYRFSARLTGTLRAGLSQRTFNDTGESSVTPYMETTASWRLLPTAFVNWSSRFGFEEPSDPNSQVQSFRTGLSVINAFSARLRGSAGVTYIGRTTTNDVVDTDVTEHTVDANLGLEYQWSRHLSLNAVYSYTDVFSTAKVSDYYRNRIFFGVEYSF
jgi:opacity protein-like surface antigen